MELRICTPSRVLMAKKKFIRLRVSEAEKQDIEEYVEDSPEFDDVSDMLRTLVHVEMSDLGNEPALSQDEITSAVEMGISGVNEELEEIREEIGVIKTQIGDEKGIKDLAADIYDILPRHSEEDPFEWEIRSEENTPNYPEGADPVMKPDSESPRADSLSSLHRKPVKPAIADYLKETEEDVQRALAYAEMAYPDVKVEDPPFMPERGHKYSRYYRLELQ